MSIYLELFPRIFYAFWFSYNYHVKKKNKILKLPNKLF